MLGTPEKFKFALISGVSLNIRVDSLSDEAKEAFSSDLSNFSNTLLDACNKMFEEHGLELAFSAHRNGLKVDVIDVPATNSSNEA